MPYKVNEDIPLKEGLKQTNKCYKKVKDEWLMKIFH